MILVMQRTPARNSTALRWTGNESLIRDVKSECKFQTVVVAVREARAAAAAADTTGTIGA
jgi:hypothetical protein